MLKRITFATTNELTMTTYAISARTNTGQKLYWNGSDFSTSRPMKEDCNHRDFEKAFKNAPSGTVDINLVAIDSLQQSAKIERRETIKTH